MDEPIINPMIRELQTRLGHGGFCCALPGEFKAQLICRVPWKECKITFSCYKPQELQVLINVYAERGYGKRKLYHFYGTFDLCNPKFDPDKAIDDIVRMLKLIKAAFVANHGFIGFDFKEAINAVSRRLGRSRR